MSLLSTPARLTFEFDSETFQQGQAVSGTLVFHGESKGLTFSQINLVLAEIAGSAGTDHRLVTPNSYTSRVENKLPGRYHVNPGETLRVPFAVNLPINARTSYGDTGWGLEVTINDPGGLNRFDAIQVEKGPCINRIARACQTQLQFREEPVYPSWKNQTGATLLRLLPGGAWKQKIKAVELHLIQQSNGDLTGQAQITIKPGNPLSQLLFWKNKPHQYDITFPAEYLTADTSPTNQTALASILIACLENLEGYAA